MGRIQLRVGEVDAHEVVGVGSNLEVGSGSGSGSDDAVGSRGKVRSEAGECLAAGPGDVILTPRLVKLIVWEHRPRRSAIALGIAVAVGEDELAVRRAGERVRRVDLAPETWMAEPWPSAGRGEGWQRSSSGAAAAWLTERAVRRY